MTREEADFIGGMNMCDEISNEAYRKIMCHCEEQEPVLDKIRAEIKAASLGKWYVGRTDGKAEEVLLMADVLQILDKYKAESEIENGNDK